MEIDMEVSSGKSERGADRRCKSHYTDAFTTMIDKFRDSWPRGILSDSDDGWRWNSRFDFYPANIVIQGANEWSWKIFWNSVGISRRKFANFNDGRRAWWTSLRNRPANSFHLRLAFFFFFSLSKVFYRINILELYRISHLRKLFIIL